MLLVSTGTLENVFQLIVVLIIFVVVLVLTYYTTKWIAGYQKKHGTGGNVEIIETAKIGNGRFLEIVKVGKDRYFVIAFGKNEITSLGEISKEDLVDLEKTKNSSLAAHGFSSGKSFGDILSSFKAQKHEEKEEKGDSESED
ncbi:MAG: flagellar biosynthetic protein FliO [Lachnospiraceae bacterium]|nr:flagellar biosynthetic protein FliO [Lachnospiraceae bacterium]